MITRIPITKNQQLLKLDDKEILAGYLDGYENAPAPGNNRSYSYWHGWRNGKVDGKHAKIDSSQQLLAEDYVSVTKSINYSEDK